ncbi:MAG: ribosome-associated translation inhibitor RaiA [Clostridia bacterium]
MKIEIINKNYEVSEKLKNILEKKIARFEKYFDDSVSVRVNMKGIGKDKYCMEITINYGKGLIRSEVTSDNMYDNVDTVLPKIEGQIRKHKTKLKKNLKQNAFEEDDTIFDVPEEKETLLVRVKPTPLTRMSTTDAMQELELIGHKFYVFINDKNDLVNVVYLRDDGDIGLLDLIY